MNWFILANELIQYSRNASIATAVIYANQETSLQQYFALKMYTFSYSSYPFFRPFETGLFALSSLCSRLNQSEDV